MSTSSSILHQSRYGLDFWGRLSEPSVQHSATRLLSFCDMAPTALGSAAVAAHTAFWAAPHGGRALPLEIVQKPLVAYFTGRGEALAELPTDVDVSDMPSWRDEWLDIAKSAGIGEERDQKRIVNWLEKRFAGPGGTKAVGVAAKALETLDAHGVALSAAIISDLEKALASGEAGDALAQCTSCLTVALLYTGSPYSPADEEEWQRLKAALPVGSNGTIDITAFDSYTKLHKSNRITLERALRSGVLFESWFAKTINIFAAQALPKAVTMLQSVVNHARAQSPGSVKRQLMYLHGYFFTEYLGLGIPEVVGVRSAFIANSPDARDVIASLPTSSAPLDMALAAASGMSMLGMVQQPGAVDLETLSMGGSSFGTGSSIGPGSSVSTAGLTAQMRQQITAEVLQQVRESGALSTPAEPMQQQTLSAFKCFFCSANCSGMKDGACRDAVEAKESLAAKRNEVVRKRIASAAEAKRMADAKAKGTE
jgi:hypothetical protein